MSGQEGMIESLRGLGDFNAQAAREAAPILEEALKASAGAGMSPDGKAWAAKKDGGRAMAGAAAHVQVKAHGDIVRATLTGPDVFHHFSKKAHEPRRQVLPDEATRPAVVDEALERGADRAFARIMGGGR